MDAVNEADVIARAVNLLSSLRERLTRSGRGRKAAHRNASVDIQTVIDILAKDENSQLSKELRVNGRVIALLGRMTETLISLGCKDNPYVAEAENVVDTWKRGQDGCGNIHSQVKYWNIPNSTTFSLFLTLTCLF